MTRRLVLPLAALLLSAFLITIVPSQSASAAMPPEQVVAGSAFTCVLASSGQTYCWGSNSNGQLGDGTAVDRTLAVAVQQSGASFVSITAGSAFACGLTGTGKAYCWGANSNGRLGDGTTSDRSTAVAVSQGALVFKSISAGGSSTCALSTLGAAYCWGFNGNGRLGDTTTSDRLTPTAVSQSGLTFSSIVVGSGHTCALAAGGATYCWGYNSNGRLGNGGTTDSAAPVAVTQGGATYASISVGDSHTCGMTSGGAVYCWGKGANGRLGNNATTDALTPVAVQQGGTTFVSLTLGSEDSCALTAEGNAYCWGINPYGEVGDNTTIDRLTPVAVSGSLTFASLGASGAAQIMCGVKTLTQLVYCWGNRLQGRIGDNAGYALSQPRPVASGGSHAFTQTVIGGNFGCGLSSGQAYCWGANGNGQLGDATTWSHEQPVPVTQAGVAFSSIAAGDKHACGLTGLGQAYCWGAGANGRLGNNSTSDRTAPVMVQQGAITFTSIGAGYDSSCGLTGGGQTYCWGYDGDGGLGDAANTDSALPVAVHQSGLAYTSLSVGSSHKCALNAGQAYCWGNDANGRLGDNASTNQNVPVAAQQAGATFNVISAGNAHTCALTSGGIAYCWGANGNGQVGNGLTADRFVPTAVSGGLTFSSISAGFIESCGVQAGVARCWGRNHYGQLGDGTTSQRTTPTTVTGGINFANLAASALVPSVCGTALTTGLQFCWGNDSYAQLGDWTVGDALKPVQTAFMNTANGADIGVTIDPSLTFAVSSHTGSCNSVAQTGGTTSSSAVALGHLSLAANVVGAQDLQLITNAGSGFTVFVSGSPVLSDVNGHAIAASVGTNSAPVPFSSAGIEAFGYTTSEAVLGTGAANRFTNGGPNWAALSPVGSEVSFGSGPTNHTVCVAFQVGISTATKAGDYSDIVTYTAVPAF